MFLALFIPASVALFLTSQGKTRLIAGIGVFSTALALVLTGSRGAYLGSIAGSIGAAFLLRRHIPVRALARVGVIAAVGAVFLIALAFVVGYSDLLLDRIGRFEGSSHIATSGRSTIWGRAIAAMIENPISFITGFGFNAYESSRSFYAATHNQYLNNLYNLGIVGVGAFIGIFALLLAKMRSSLPQLSADTRPHAVAGIFGTCAFLVAIFFSEYHNVGYLLWAYLGVLMRIVVCQTQETSTVTPHISSIKTSAQNWRETTIAQVPNPSRGT
jgi:O-antigen ligase